ncbi:MAG: hypothetical protein ACSHWZ_03375 [Sulfitobacter sp.]
MSFQPQFPGLFSPAHGAAPVGQMREQQAELPLRAPLAPTPKQISYARTIAVKTGSALPQSALAERSALSAWIDAHKPKQASGPFSHYPSSKQVAFAERIARIKRSEVPRECFHDKTLMSRWIDGNMPRKS